ncbi:alpha/beta fold hydrolase [Actinomadura sp. WMMB 499]|uniref:alpha/beta fold hydrolase n=1 Tax=Actinomadura sp. WMMB 499 TaxID=1219491 RepID=UPI001248DE14|nr:alpha/beta fold hydrolase [Actinomadura sp. WMMB 499]QFG27050.1 alpha/beta fold hydrolase [Actinomadura sp. WMMB 499]
MTYYFDQFALNVGLGQLRHDRGSIRIEPRAFALLCYLVEHRDRVVSKRELLDTVWKGEAVTEAVLTTGLRTVRRAIGDTGREQRFIRTVHRRGYQFVAPTTEATTTVAPAGAPDTAAAVDGAGARDVIRFCRTADGARIAWAATGAGPPLVRTANWLSRLDLERAAPMFTHWFEGLTRGRRLIRYDERGYGLSDWTTGFTLDEWIGDLDAVADAAGLDRFPLLGVAQGGPLAVAYAARRPERVSRLILNAAYTRGRLARARDAAERDEAALDLKITLAGWNARNRSYLRFFGAQFFAGGPPRRWDEFTGHQRLATSAANGARFLEEQTRIDVSGLAPRVSCPTLIVHSRDDPRVPVSQATELAGLVPDSRLVLLDGRNHLLTADEPAWPRFLDELHAFLAEDEPGRG